MDQKENVVRHSSSVTAALGRHELTKLPKLKRSSWCMMSGNNKNGVFIH
jgi:hypothetical protein